MFTLRLYNLEHCRWEGVNYVLVVKNMWLLITSCTFSHCSVLSHHRTYYINAYQQNHKDSTDETWQTEISQMCRTSVRRTLNTVWHRRWEQQTLKGWQILRSVWKGKSAWAPYTSISRWSWHIPSCVSYVFLSRAMLWLHSTASRLVLWHGHSQSFHHLSSQQREQHALHAPWPREHCMCADKRKQRRS